MKRTAVCVFLLSLLLAAVSVFGEEAKVVTTASGEVVSVDAKTKSLLVKVENDPAGQSRDLTFAVGQETKILKDSQPIALSDIKAGDKVTVSFRTASGKNMAMSIDVQTKPAA